MTIACVERHLVYPNTCPATPPRAFAKYIRTDDTRVVWCGHIREDDKLMVSVNVHNPRDDTTKNNIIPTTSFDEAARHGFGMGVVRSQERVEHHC